jgi:hypothetical protein
MGLDQYLRAEKYASGYEFSSEESRNEYTGLVEQFDVGAYVDPETPSATVSFTVAYWRKANQIHQWFVENVQGGEDECRPHHVSRDQLKELRELCLRVLATAKTEVGVLANTIPETEGRKILNPDEIEEILPTTSGFFFGSTDYGEWYLRDLEDTIKQIDRALGMPEGWSFEYQSSW